MYKMCQLAKITKKKYYTKKKCTDNQPIVGQRRDCFVLGCRGMNFVGFVKLCMLAVLVG